jgi:hypothetical protein
MKTNIPVIGRYCQCEKGEKEVGADDQGRIPYLFFPSLPANKYNIISWTWYGEHGEACLDFYHICKAMPKKETEKVLKQYLNSYSIDENEIYKIRIRLNHNTLRNAWKEGEK